MNTSKRQLSVTKLIKVAKILKVIAHPVRLEILTILELEEPLTVSSIRGRISVEVEQSMLSHHLTKMKDNGIITSYKKGKNVYYTIVDRNILTLFDCMESCDAF